MGQKRGQLTIEWITIIVFLMTALIPATYFLIQSFEGVRGDYEYTKTDSYGREIVENAERIYYSGLYSKTTLTPSLDDKYITINDVYVASIFNRTWRGDYLLINATDWDQLTSFMYLNAKVPLGSNNCTPVNHSYVFSECGLPQYNCTICYLDARRFLYSNLEIESYLNRNEMVVNITFAR